MSALPTVRIQRHELRQRGIGELPLQLERDAPPHQGGEEDDQGQIEGREHGGVPAGEGGERRRSRHDQPDLVAVPDGPDRVDQHAPLQVVAPDERVQHADPEVEPLQHEEADPEDGHDDEPEHSE